MYASDFSRGGVAQLVEQGNHNPCVRGSSPCTATIFLSLFSPGAHRAFGVTNTSLKTSVATGACPFLAVTRQIRRSSFVMILHKIRQTIEKHRMLSPGDGVVVAVSGGPDSVCLLSVLHALTRDLGLTLHVAHLDHRFRGTESAEDARFVAELAKRLGLPATVDSLDVPAYCRERGLSVQEGARKVRYGFLEQVARDAGADRIATGHTADDQAETFLMRLMRGAGVSGLSAIPPVRDNFIRPLIETTREAVLAHLRAEQLEFRTDSSNAKSVYTRNRIRNEALPLLRTFNPRIVETLAAEAALLRDEDEAVESYLASVAEEASVQKDGGFVVKRNAVETLPPAFRRRLFRRIAELAGLDPSQLSLARVNEALSFLVTAQTGRTMHLSRGISITREYNHFRFAAEKPAEGFSVALAAPGTCEIPAVGWTIEAVIDGGSADAAEANYRWQAELDYDKIKPPLTFRSRLPGDRFCPAGMGGRSKKLQDYLVDEKIPRRKRDAVLLLCAGNDILWVVGHRLDERFLAGPETKRVLTIRVKKTAEAIQHP